MTPTIQRLEQGLAPRCVRRRKLRAAVSASVSVIALGAAFAGGEAFAQCTGPTNNVVTCAPGTYAGIGYTAANPGLTINVAPGVTVTTFGVGSTGNGTIVINGGPSDSFNSTTAGVPGLYAVTNVGNVNLTGGSVVGGTGAAPGVVAETNAGDVSINVTSATSPANSGIFVGSNGTGAPGNITVTAGSVTGLLAGIDITGATGNVIANVTGTVSSSGGVAVFIAPAGNATAENVTVNVANTTGGLGAVEAVGTGKVVVKSGNASATYTGSPAFPPGTYVGFGVLAESDGGTVQVTSGNATATSTNPASAVAGIATGDVGITSGSAIETGGGYADNLTMANGDTFNASDAVLGISGQGNVTIKSGQAHTYGGEQDDAIDAVALNGCISITSGDATTTGLASDGIFALGSGDITITSSGNVTTTGGIFFEAGGTSSTPFAPTSRPAGNYAADGIFAMSTAGNVKITANNVSASGAGADGIVADASLNIDVTVTGNVSANDIGLELSSSQSGGQTKVKVQSGGIVAGGFVGVDLSGSNAGVNRTALASDQGAITLTNNGTITGGNGGFGVWLGAGNGATNINNSGTISGGAFGIAVSGFVAFTSPLTIHNIGAINGGFAAVNVGLTDQPLIINGGGNFTGGQYGILAFDETGPITINAGTVGPTAQNGVVAETTTGDIKVTTDTVGFAAGTGIFADATTGNVTINAGTTTAANYAVDGGSTSGAVTITSGDATATAPAGQIANAVLGIAGGDVKIVSANATATGGYVANTTAGTEAYTSPVIGMSGQGNVSITSTSASATAASNTTGGGEVIYAQALNGTITINSGTAAAVGDGAAGIRATAAGDIKIVSGNVTTSGDLFAEPGGHIDLGGPADETYAAGNYTAEGIAAISAGGNVKITAANVTTTGVGADGIVANAGGADNITITGNVTSAQATSIALASGAASKVTVGPGAIVSGIIGLDASGTDTGFADGDNTAGVIGGLSIVDNGAITGTGGTAIQFSPGANSLTLGTGWAVNGSIVGGTNNALILAGSFGAPTPGQDAPSFSDFSSLEVKAGYWTLPAPASYANTTVDPASSFEIDANLVGDLVDHGDVGGTGAIVGSVTIASGGIFSPGALVTTSVVGSLKFANGSTYLAQVAAGGAGDLIAVNGAVSIKSGATFEAEPLGDPTTYNKSTSYTVITATGGVNGTFSNVISDAPLLSASLSYPHDQVALLLTRNDKSFASQAATPNEVATASAVEAGGPGSPLYSALVGQTALGLQQGYAALSGEGYADVGSMMLDQSDQTRASLVNRMNEPAQARGLWVASYGDRATADAGANFAHAQTSLGGNASGVDATFFGWRVGVATGFGHDSLSISARGTSTLDTWWTTSGYAAYTSGPFDFRLGATYGSHRLESNREVFFPGFADANRSFSHLSSGEEFAEAGWTLKTEHSWIEPFAGVAVDTVGGFALAESGGDTALDVATEQRTLITERLGVQGETSLFGLSLHGAIAWRHAGGDLTGIAHAAFQGTGETFIVHGLPIAANAAEVSGGLSGRLDRRTTFDLSYHGEAGDHFSDNTVKLNANWSF